MNVRRAIIKTGDVTLEVEGRLLELAGNRRALPSRPPWWLPRAVTTHEARVLIRISCFGLRIPRAFHSRNNCMKVDQAEFETRALLNVKKLYTGGAMYYDYYLRLGGSNKINTIVTICAEMIDGIIQTCVFT
jgi:hypothetical protein